MKHSDMDLLTLIAESLLKKETITKEEIEYLVEHGELPDEEIKEQDETPKKTTKKEDK